MLWRKKVKTSFGLKIIENGVPALPNVKIYERALTIFIEECVKRFDEIAVRHALSKAVVEWWDKIAPSINTGELNTVVVDDGQVYSGLAIGNFCKVAWRGRLHRSAFCHELLHVVGLQLFGIDPFHQNGLLWSLERSINALLEKERL